MPRTSSCPMCGEILKAEVVFRDGWAVLLRECPTHGKMETPYFKDAELYRHLERTSAADRIAFTDPTMNWSGFAPFVTTIAVDVTNRCNLYCPNCFSVSGPSGPVEAELTVQEISDALPDLPRGAYRPNISLVGGESALREDLGDIIRAIRAKGFTPRLNSNGLLLEDAGLVGKLHAAGLRWVILQFDGFSSETSIRFRGRDLTALKSKVIENLASFGINVHLAVMVEAGTNDGELHDILCYASRTPNILRVSFFPRTEVGRHKTGEGEGTPLAHLLESCETHSGGRLTRKDFFAQRRLWSILFKLTGNPLFRTRPCIMPVVLVPQGDSYVPFNRIWNPFAGPGGGHVLRRLVDVPLLKKFDEGAFGKRFLLVNLEKFFSNDAFLLEDSLNCHHVYLTREGYIPFCRRNSFSRANAC